MSEGSKLTIPISIVIAGALIAGAIFFVNRDNTSPQATGAGSAPATNEDANLKPVSSEDHILGSPDASIVIVEFSDTECPFCKNFHVTMHRIIDTYGRDGQVAWVYRHFPIVQLHSKAPKQAEATECAAELGGNTAFWSYVDRLFEITPSNNGLDMTLLPEIAEEIGLDRGAFVKCLESGRMASRVQEDFEDARASGGRGTPHSLMVVNGGEQIIQIPGAQPFSAVQSAIETALSQQGQGTRPEHKAVPAI